MADIIPTPEDLLRKGIYLFQTLYTKQKPKFVGCAPGRLNIIGEHTDYNNGFVFPMALPMVTMVIGALNNTTRINIYTDANLKESNSVTFRIPDMEDLAPGKPAWANYVKGTVSFFQGGIVPGFDAVIVSSIPMESGLGGSAALEVATYNFLEELTGAKTEPVLKAAICQKAEHILAQNPCGIMDQFISIYGQKDHAILLDCSNLLYEQVPFNDPNISVLITNSNIKNEYYTGKQYSLRRTQCYLAAKVMGCDFLRDCSLHDLLKLRTNMEDNVFHRAKHVITEISRTIDMAQAMRIKDFSSAGLLMVQGQNSLRDDFAVTCPDIDELIEITMAAEGVYGSRLTGGGFRGCTFSLVKSTHVESVIQHTKKYYHGAADYYSVSPCDATLNLKHKLDEINKESCKIRKPVPAAN